MTGSLPANAYQFVPSAIGSTLRKRRSAQVCHCRPKAWLGAGHAAAAENHARLWSLIASCERHAVDPQRYLTIVLAKIGQTPAEELAQFLPDAWKVEDAAEPLH